MAKEIPSAGERQPGGAKVIGISVTPCPSPSAEIALPRNPIPPLKKEDSGFSVSILSPLLSLSAAQDRSPRQRNPPNTADTRWFLCWRNTIGNGGENLTSVTTRHVLLPVQRRKTAFSLPIWLRKFPCFRSRLQSGKREGGRGVGSTHPTQGLDPRGFREFLA